MGVNERNIKDNEFSTWLILICIFAYSFIVFYLLRELILPRITTDIYEGNLFGDPLQYHNIALSLSEQIRIHGFQFWQLHPNGQGPAGIMSLVYVFTKSSLSIVTINAILHSIAGTTLITLLRKWFGTGTSIVSASVFVISPYQMHWFSQINKDSYLASGIMLFVFGAYYMVQNFYSRKRYRSLLKYFGYSSIGILLIYVARPFVVSILQYFSILFLLLIFMYTIICTIYSKKNVSSNTTKNNSISFSIIMIYILCLTPLTEGATSDSTISDFENSIKEFSISDKNYIYQNLVDYPMVSECLNETMQEWKDSYVFPNTIDVKVEALLLNRCLFYILKYEKNTIVSNSVQEAKIELRSTKDVLMYIPKAIIIGLFSPLPQKWFSRYETKISIFYTVVSMEMILFYLSFASLFVWLIFFCKSPAIYIIIALCVCIIGIYGIAVPFVGALYRYRYPFWVIIQSFGICSMIQLVKKSHERYNAP